MKRILLKSELQEERKNLVTKNRRVNVFNFYINLSILALTQCFAHAAFAEGYDPSVNDNYCGEFGRYLTLDDAFKSYIQNIENSWHVPVTPYGDWSGGIGVAWGSSLTPDGGPCTGWVFSHLNRWDGADWEYDAVWGHNAVFILQDNHNPYSSGKEKNYGPPSACISAGNPINSGTGNKYQEEVDYKQGGPFPIMFSRQYNSFNLPKTGISSYGWRWIYGRSISYAGNATTRVFIIRPGQQVLYFSLSNGKWSSDGDVTDQLTQLKDAQGNVTGWKYINSDNEVEDYDSSGRLSSITNQTGLKISFFYLASGGVAFTDSYGRSATFTKDSSGYIGKLTDLAGQIYTYGHDSSGRLTSVTYPDGKRRQYLYESASYPGYLTGIIDENGNRYATWIYDSQGRATSSEHAGGAEKVTLTFNSNGSTTITDALNSVRTRNFSTILGVVKATGNSQPGGAGCSASSSAMTYDANGNVATRTDFNGNVTTYAYDLTKNLETQRVEASGKPEARTISTQWHPDWRLATRIAEPLKLTTLVYNGQPDPTNGSTTLSCAPSTALVNNKPIAVLCKKVEQPTQDSTGTQGFNAGATDTPRIWSYTYNAYGQVLTADGPRTDVNDVTTYTYYDATDADLGKRGNLATVTDALGHTWHYTAYDANSQLLSLTDPNGLITTNTYDQRQRLTAHTIGTETTSLQYDGVGQVTQLTLPDSSSLSYSYDAAHRLTQITDNLGNSIRYTLDAMGNRTKEDVKDPSGSLSKTLTRSYDALNRLQTLTGIGTE